MKVSVNQFDGLIPRVSPVSLPNSAGQIATNMKLSNGALQPINSPSFFTNNAISGAKSIFMLGAPSSVVALSWATDVDVANSPVSDTEYRVYYTGDGLPKKTTLAMALAGAAPYPNTWYLMGVTTPETINLPTVISLSVSAGVATVVFASAHGLTAGQTVKVSNFVPRGLNSAYVIGVSNATTITFSTSSVTATTIGTIAKTSAPIASATTGGGSVPSGTYSYVYTYVTQFGATLLEESAPSYPVSVTLSAPGFVSLSGINGPTSTANRNYVYKRIYRTLGSAFQLVGQIAFSETSYTDILANTQIPGDAMPSTDWGPPPDDLKGITSLPSGVLVGFRENEVWFSEPGFPHAWPLKYMQSFDSKIVGLKAFSSNVVLATESYPHIGSGTFPDSFTFIKLPFLEPCVSKRSVASDEFGVMYASANGLVAIGNDGNGVVTTQLLSREKFSYYAPDTFTAVVFERRYYGFYNSPSLGYGALVFSKSDGMKLITLDLATDAMVTDLKTGRMLYVDKLDGLIYQYDPVGTLPKTYTWKSKVFQMSHPANFSCFRIMAQEASIADQLFASDLAAKNAAIDAANATVYASGVLHSELNAMELGYPIELNGSELTAKIPAVEKTVGVVFYGSKNQLINGSYAVNTIHRLPGDTRYLSAEIMISGQQEILSVEFASSASELRNG